jgi:hypothetical protein
MKTLILILSLLVFTTITSSCSKKMTFSQVDDVDGLSTENPPGEGDGSTIPEPTPTPSTPPSCTVTYDEVTTPVKVIFLVDKSGSNKDDSNTSAANDGTDPNKTWRTNSINNLRNSLSLALFSFNITLFRANDTNINDGYRYGGAGGTVTKSLINGFSNDNNVFSSALNAMVADADQGKTPYKGALAKAHDIILADIANDTVSKYSVILITDGYPDPNLVTKTDCGSHACSPTNGADADVPRSIDKAREFVKSVVDIAPARVNVNTVYYYSAGNRGTMPVSILTGMAEEGKGVFIEAASNQTIDFQNVIRVPANTCP